MTRLEHQGVLDIYAQDTLNKLKEITTALHFVIEETN
jgi:hypothetical protein